jgi:UDP-N-acetylglucosamine 2-epimerase (non-hydrolysing)
MVSDSGTAQEEPALLDVPIIVPRDVTERPESIENGNSFMLKLQDFFCYEKSLEWLKDYFNNSNERNTDWLGDGTASTKIIEILKEKL